ncbi:ATP-grasp domain-containing protein [Micromonospora echinofusca]|uniref:ATP-grasp domain-containing protein n=1 Tax=Micromonospora echinofusca TaxID=47858 RepID=A0ABS3VL47_MICEH|nr:ATP-grasp domain-containing protein [Micromonospora echinofusca]MBO4205255.1 ATP-grasp domain-containing protein [Micromonospora echinofusca]
MTIADVVVVVEAQHSTSGLRPVTVAADLGHDVVFLTDTPDRYVDLPTFAAVTAAAGVEVAVGATGDTEGLLATVGSVTRGRRLRGIYTNCDYNLPVVAAAARKLGLPGLDPDAALRARDKLVSRQVFAAAGVPCPRFVHAVTAADARAAVADLGLPCVVKPMTESASTGVRLCHTVEDVLAHHGTISAVRYDARGQRRPPGALVEEYCLGYEVSVETVTVDGAVTVLGVTDKLLGPHPYFAELGDTFPSLLPEPVVAALAETATAALRAVGHDFGAAHTEVKMTADGPRVIEVNARLGGAEIATEIEAALGVPVLREVVRMHLGEQPQLTPTRRRGAATRYLMPPAAGRVTAVHGVALAGRIPGVTDVEVRLAPGAVVGAPTSNHQLYGHVVATAQTPAEAARRADTAANQISLQVENAH